MVVGNYKTIIYHLFSRYLLLLCIRPIFQTSKTFSQQIWRGYDNVKIWQRLLSLGSDYASTLVYRIINFNDMATTDIAQKYFILYRWKLRCYILHLTELLLGVRCSRYHVLELANGNECRNKDVNIIFLWFHHSFLYIMVQLNEM